MKNSIFGNMFDLNGDGKVDAIESIAELLFIKDVMKEANDVEEEDDFFNLLDFDLANDEDEEEEEFDDDGFEDEDDDAGWDD